MFRKTWPILSSGYSAQESTFLLLEMVPKVDHCIDGNLPVKGGIHSWELRSSVLFLALPHILRDLENDLDHEFLSDLSVSIKDLIHAVPPVSSLL